MAVVWRTGGSCLRASGVQRGRLTGKGVIHRFLDMVNAQHSAAYLETDVDGNIRQDEKFGVKVVAEEEVLGTVARVY